MEADSVNNVIISNAHLNQEIIGWLVKKLIKMNATQIWKDALDAYNLI